MMKKTIGKTVGCALAACCLFSASPRPEAAAPAAGDTVARSGFRHPIDAPRLLAGSFAEMRSDHFHSGVDYKTGGREGMPVRAAAGGEVVRVSIAPGGYGYALYVAHPDGYTTVYAHLSRFRDDIARWVKSRRRELKMNSGSLYPRRGQFPVAAGETIALSGNTGSSMGPHLHFEIRETATQRALNFPALGMLRFTDEIPPLIEALHYVEVDTVGGIPVHAAPVSIPLRRSARGRYEAADTVTLTGRGYFVLEASDRKDGVNNRMGIYRIRERVEGQQVFGYRMDGFAFDRTRYCNAVVYYPIQRRSRNEVFRLAVLEGNRLAVYDSVVSRGTIAVPEGETRQVGIEAEDDSGNVSLLELVVRGAPARDLSARAQGVPADRRRTFTRYCDGLRVVMPREVLYESIYYRQSRRETPRGNAAAAKVVRLSPEYEVHSSDVPLHGYITLSIDCEVPAALRGRAVLASVGDDGRLSSAGGRWSAEGEVTGRVRRFGTYCAVADTVPPRIAPLFAEAVQTREGERLTFSLGDNFSGIASWSATVDGAWVPLERDIIRNRVAYVVCREELAPGERHTLELEVSDGAGNRTVWRGTFRR